MIGCRKNGCPIAVELLLVKKKRFSPRNAAIKSDATKIARMEIFHHFI
jgi:hypothetical protein